MEHDFERTIERIAQCRLSAQYSEAQKLISLVSRTHSSPSVLQRNITAIEKSELLTNLGFHRRTETTLRKAIRVSSNHLGNGPSFDLAGWSHAVLLGNMAFVQFHTKGKVSEALRIEAELRKKFLEETTSDGSKIGLYVIPWLNVTDSTVESEA